MLADIADDAWNGSLEVASVPPLCEPLAVLVASPTRRLLVTVAVSGCTGLFVGIVAVPSPSCPALDARLRARFAERCSRDGAHSGADQDRDQDPTSGPRWLDMMFGYINHGRSTPARAWTSEAAAGLAHMLEARVLKRHRHVFLALVALECGATLEAGPTTAAAAAAAAVASAATSDADSSAAAAADPTAAATIHDDPTLATPSMSPMVLDATCELLFDLFRFSEWYRRVDGAGAGAGRGTTAGLEGREHNQDSAVQQTATAAATKATATTTAVTAAVTAAADTATTAAVATTKATAATAATTLSEPPPPLEWWQKARPSTPPVVDVAFLDIRVAAARRIALRVVPGSAEDSDVRVLTMGRDPADGRISDEASKMDNLQATQTPGGNTLYGGTTRFTRRESAVLEHGGSLRPVSARRVKLARLAHALDWKNSKAGKLAHARANVEARNLEARRRPGTAPVRRPDRSEYQRSIPPPSPVVVRHKSLSAVARRGHEGGSGGVERYHASSKKGVSGHGNRMVGGEGVHSGRHGSSKLKGTRGILGEGTGAGAEGPVEGRLLDSEDTWVTYHSASAAGRALGFGSGKGVANCVNGRQDQMCGYEFRWPCSEGMRRGENGGRGDRGGEGGGAREGGGEEIQGVYFGSHQHGQMEELLDLDVLSLKDTLRKDKSTRASMKGARSANRHPAGTGAALIDYSGEDGGTGKEARKSTQWLLRQMGGESGKAVVGGGTVWDDEWEEHTGSTSALANSPSHHHRQPQPQPRHQQSSHVQSIRGQRLVSSDYDTNTSSDADRDRNRHRGPQGSGRASPGVIAEPQRSTRYRQGTGRGGKGHVGVAGNGSRASRSAASATGGDDGGDDGEDGGGDDTPWARRLEVRSERESRDDGGGNMIEKRFRPRPGTASLYEASRRRAALKANTAASLRGGDTSRGGSRGGGRGGGRHQAQRDHARGGARVGAHHGGNGNKKTLCRPRSAVTKQPGASGPRLRPRARASTSTYTPDPVLQHLSLGAHEQERLMGAGELPGAMRPIQDPLFYSALSTAVNARRLSTERTAREMGAAGGKGGGNGAAAGAQARPGQGGDRWFGLQDADRYDQRAEANEPIATLPDQDNDVLDPYGGLRNDHLVAMVDWKWRREEKKSRVKHHYRHG